MWLCVVPLVCVLVVRGSTKSVGTNAPLTRMTRQMSVGTVAPEDIARGYRVVDEGAGGVLPLPPGAVTNDPLRLRGGYDWAFRVAPEGWRFSYRDGHLTGVTVLARGEVRPDVGTLYFPVPITNGVSLLPEARWHLLSDGGASVFRHAVTEDGTLLLDWHGALVGRDVNCPTNLQMELRADGGFAWRTDGGARFFLPVLPFDWDGDGLENSVDPEPFVAHPFDCHGANAEWYGVVCSNVFTHIEAPGVQSIALPDDEETFFTANANDRAYYFVEVVAEQGPVPIYFVADRDSWLGSPVVVARGGETNRVPLLVGVEYAVTSTVPISVSVSDADYAEVTENDACDYTVKWPLAFEFIEELGGEGRFYTVDVTPFDPGGEFVWGTTARGRTSGCWSGLGSFVSSGCSGFCGCGGCSVYGYFRFDGARFDFSGGSCGCSDEDDEDDESGSGGVPNTNFGPGVSVTADTSTIVFEDEYSNDHDDTVPRRSTWMCVTVEFAAGIADASCSVELTGGASKVVMHENSEGGPVCTSRRYNLKKNRTVTKKFYIEGVGPSGETDDITLRAEISGGGSDSDSASLTVHEVEIEPSIQTGEKLKNRHKVGSGEIFLVKVQPVVEVTVDPSMAEMPGQDGAVKVLRAPYFESTMPISLSVGDVSFSTSVCVLEPSDLVVVYAETAPPRNNPVIGYVGNVGMNLGLMFAPTNLAFDALEMKEQSAVSTNYTGYFATDVGAAYRVHNTGGWQVMNFGTVLNDEAAIEDCVEPWSAGFLEWHIPNVWRIADESASRMEHTFKTYYQRFRITADGTVYIQKFGWCVSRAKDSSEATLVKE